MKGYHWNPDKLRNHRGMLGKTHGQYARKSISNAQKGRKHQLQEGFQKGHEAIKGTERTRFKKGFIPWNKGKIFGRDLDKPKYQAYKSNAKIRKIEFELTLEEFKKIKNGKCYLCGEQAIGVDRKDNSKGYIEGNMFPCCGMCNRMKNHFEFEDFLKKCKQIIMVTGYEI